MDALKKLCLIAIFISPAANATLVTVNAADFATGSVITAPGMSIRAVYSPSYSTDPANEEIFFSDVISRPGGVNLAPHIFSGTLPTGTLSAALDEIGTGSLCHDRIVSGAALPGSFCFFETWSFIEISFDNPTFFVEGVGGFSDNDGGSLWAFDSTGTRITCAGSVVCGGYNEYGVGQYGSTMNTATPLISSIRFGAALFGGSIAMSSFTFDDGYSVAEPGTLALFGVGLLLPLMLRRRRARAPG
jgi:hypothetical protein